MYLVPVWFPIMLGYDSMIFEFHVVANIILCIFIVALITYTFIIYARTKKRADNFYSEDVHSRIQWVVKSMYFFVGLAIIACISPFSNNYSLWVCVFYLLYQLFVYVYIYESIQRFELASISLFSECELGDIEVEPVEVLKPVNINDSVVDHIEERLNDWIKHGGFLVHGVTVKSVASDIYTNRTYLSNYINTTYNYTFKVWITKLRIDESKKLMCDHKEFSINDIALMSGFLSAGSFIQVFSKSEGVSPVTWREENKSFRHRRRVTESETKENTVV